MSQHQHVRRKERRPPPPPREADDRLVASIGTAAWAVALVVVLIARDALPGGSQWWVWTCVTGIVMGLFAMWYVPILKRGRQRAANRRRQPSGADSGYVSRDSGSKTVSSTETPGSSTKS
ncbi:MAG TPA: DUF2530 domain-containing protein [Streptosporangiaceae bacterium]|nr:DUF2530 domain-containing protein [Streptosporangiaceae bacterium]